MLKTVELDGRSAIVAGGNDEAGTMYAAYELLERLGIVFQLTNDIIPQQKPDLPMPALDVRMEPAFKDRGMHCWHGIRWYMGLAELRQEIDQLAKLKMNVFQFYWGMGGPWAEFSYDGKVAEISGKQGVRLRRLAGGQRNRQQRASSAGSVFRKTATSVRPSSPASKRRRKPTARPASSSAKSFATPTRARSRSG